MEFLKKNYEKIILGIVLFGMAGGAASLPIMISSERADLVQKQNDIIKRPAKPLPPLDLQHAEQLLARASSSIKLDLATTNRVFNSMQWQKRTSDGAIIKVTDWTVGPQAVTVTKTVALYTTITLDAVTPSDAGARYVIGVEREAAASVTQRRKKQYPATLNNKNEIFVLREVKGPPENPVELVLELNDTGEKASVAKDKPFQRVDGYTADLSYAPEKRNWTARRVGDSLRVANEDYIIVAINKNEVVLSAKSNNKKTLISYNPAP